MIGKLRYAFDEIRDNYQRQTWWQNRVANRIVGPIQAEFHDDPGIRVLEEEWDTLIVLDACRADLFEEVSDTANYDSYRRVYSAGSATNEWTRANFSGQALTDCVYVTGNPVVSRHVVTAFHCFLEPWRAGFDPELGTVPPEAVVEAALDARNRFPDKRLIVHFLQPHYPFLDAPELRYAEFNQTEEVSVEKANSGATDVWEAVGLGYESADDVWDAYADNLKCVMDAAEPLLDRPEQTVITSDHGNMLGERMPYIPLRLYGHPSGIHHPVLREVPWAVIGGQMVDEENRQISADVEDQLRSLGYTD